jgi:hypothetical protein
VTDAITGLYDNRFYLTSPDTDGLISNVWTSVLFYPIIDYQFNYDSLQNKALDQSLLLRYKQEDPLFVSKLNPNQIRQDLTRLLQLPDSYSSGIADGFDYYNALAATDEDIQNLAIEAFLFNSNLSIVITALDRLFVHAKLDDLSWGQAITVGKKEDLSLLTAYQTLYYLSLALNNQLDQYYSDVLTVIAPDSERLAALRSGTASLNFTSTDDLLLLFRFALLTIPNKFANLSGLSSELQFQEIGRLELNWEERKTLILSTLQNVGVNQLAINVATALKIYENGARLVADSAELNDPRLIPTRLAKLKYNIINPDDGLISQALSSTPSSANDFPNDDIIPHFEAFEKHHIPSLDNLYEPKVHDEKRFVAITEEVITELDDDGKPQSLSIIALTLSEPAPAGGVVVPLKLIGNATYGANGDFAFKDESKFPSYIYIPHGESSAYLELDPRINSYRDFNAVIEILDPTMSYNRSKDMDRVYIFKAANDTSRNSAPRLYDNDQLVRLNLDPEEPESFYSPSAFDKSFPFTFYKDSTVVGIEAKESDAKPLRLYAHDSFAGVRRYTLGEPEPHPLGGQWLLLEENIINVYEGDKGQDYVPIREYYSTKLGDYYYLPSGQNNSRFLGSEWQDLGVRFSLRTFSPAIGYALGTLRTRVSSNLSYLKYPTRDTLSNSNRDLVTELGYKEALISDTQYSFALDARPQNISSPNRPERLTYSAVYDTASFAGSLWDPVTGIQENTAPALIIFADGQATDLNYNPLGKSGARFYSLNGFYNDTVAIDGAISNINKSDIQLTLALNDAKPELQATTSGLSVSHGSSQAIRNHRYNVDLNVNLELIKTKTLSGLGDYAYYLLPYKLDPADSMSQDLTKESLLQSGLQIFQSSSGMDSYLGTAFGDKLFSASFQLSVGSELTVVALHAGTEQGVVLAGKARDAGASIVDFMTPEGDRIAINISDKIAGLDDFISRTQFSTPGINLLGLGKKSSFRMDLSREASITSSIGLYRSIDIDGGVLDPISGNTFYPGDPGYKEAALSQANTLNLPTGITVANRSSLTNQIFELNEDSVLFPYAISNGTAHFAFASANTDGMNRFRTLGHNAFGYEDLPAAISDFDFDDILIKISSVSTN